MSLLLNGNVDIDVLIHRRCFSCSRHLRMDEVLRLPGTVHAVPLPRHHNRGAATAPSMQSFPTPCENMRAGR